MRLRCGRSTLPKAIRNLPVVQRRGVDVKRPTPVVHFGTCLWVPTFCTAVHALLEKPSAFSERLFDQHFLKWPLASRQTFLGINFIGGHLMNLP